MKVLMFGWELPPFNSGGLGVACLGLTRALSELGTKVTFVLPRTVPIKNKPCDLVFADSFGGKVKMKPVDVLLSPYMTSGAYGLSRRGKADFYGKSLLSEVLRYAELASLLSKEEDFDVIHAHDWLSFPAGLAAKSATGKKLVVQVHATEFDRCGGNNINGQVYAIEKEGMEKADKIIAVSNFTKNIISKNYGIHPEKISVVHNGIDESEYTNQSETPSVLENLKKEGGKIVLFVGRITLQKGPDYFVSLAKRVLEFIPDVYFVVSGSGDMERRMMDDVARSHMGNRFIFTGFLRGEELNRVYRCADVYVMPSVSEPFGITPLESMANGTPVIISRQTGVSEVVSHALKSDFWDIDDMADKVVSILSHDSLKECMKNNGRHEIKKVGWKSAAEKCLAVYNFKFS